MRAQCPVATYERMAEARLHQSEDPTTDHRSITGGFSIGSHDVLQVCKPQIATSKPLRAFGPCLFSWNQPGRYPLYDSRRIGAHERSSADMAFPHCSRLRPHRNIREHLRPMIL